MRGRKESTALQKVHGPELSSPVLKFVTAPHPQGLNDQMTWGKLEDIEICLHHKRRYLGKDETLFPKELLPVPRSNSGTIFLVLA